MKLIPLLLHSVHYKKRILNWNKLFSWNVVDNIELNPDFIYLSLYLGLSARTTRILCFTFYKNCYILKTTLHVNKNWYRFFYSVKVYCHIYLNPRFHHLSLVRLEAIFYFCCYDGVRLRLWNFSC